MVGRSVESRLRLEHSSRSSKLRTDVAIAPADVSPDARETIRSNVFGRYAGRSQMTTAPGSFSSG